MAGPRGPRPTMRSTAAPQRRRNMATEAHHWPATAHTLLAALVLAHAAHAAPPPVAEPPGARLVAAAGLINSGKPADAAKILEDLRRTDPTNIQVLRLLGRAYLRDQQPD